MAMRVIPDTIDTGSMLLMASPEGKRGVGVSSLLHAHLHYSNFALSPLDRRNSSLLSESEQLPPMSSS